MLECISSNWPVRNTLHVGSLRVLTLVGSITDMARDLLELVVEGPEGDAIWEAYQGGSDNESNGDESHLDPGHLDTHDVIDVGS